MVVLELYELYVYYNKCNVLDFYEGIFFLISIRERKVRMLPFDTKIGTEVGIVQYSRCRLIFKSSYSYYFIYFEICF